MGQTPAIIVDSSAFNGSGPWGIITQGSGGYKDTAIELLNSPAISGSGDGNFSIKISPNIVYFLEDSSFQLMLIGNGLINCTLQRIDAGFSPNLLPPTSSTAFIFDNIMWILGVGMEISFSLKCPAFGSILFDYALASPDPNTPLDNQLLFVNDTDSTIKLEGQWQSSAPGGGPGMSSAITGDILQFPFTGWNITLLGYFDSDTSGNITLGVSLDEQPQVQLDFSGEAQQSLVPFRYFEYFTLVQQESDSGNHTITVEVLEASLSQIFGFRGFTYIPGFATLNEMPDLSTPTASHTSTSSPTTTPSLSGPGQSPHPELHGGALSGVIVGAIFGICLTVLILWAAWRQIKRRKYLSPGQAWVESILEAHHPLAGPDNVTPSDKGPRDMSHRAAANAHGITPFTKRYSITSTALDTAGDIGQDHELPVQGSTVILPPGEGTGHLSLFPVEPPSNGINALNHDGDQTMPPEPDRTELLLERLNNLMNAIQHPPAYGEDVSP
ncbi:hypothetical protein BDP27DRAFT_1514663 [Rhodocollybia butyracea]|uniref:Uncharacterized protein n=1 Tax=Rhodocollybia butyracea TaxID=206335 RepID=A0A9P5TVY7_9AGAR|nr:hypothetical protein BDP27DRAFT_1514663 [Rhodocollybia butyracea]